VRLTVETTRNDAHRRIGTGPWPALVRWWDTQGRSTRLAVVVAGVFTLASMLNVMSASLARTARHASAAPSVAATVKPTAASTRLTLESAPTIPGKLWMATKVWQGNGNGETEAFTVAEHWRVDWIFSTVKSGGSLQVFVYEADSRMLLNLSANTQQAGAATSFWAGAGTYFLKINSSQGDWKISVQDLR
jgi:hypothetical protein